MLQTNWGNLGKKLLLTSIALQNYLPSQRYREIFSLKDLSFKFIMLCIFSLEKQYIGEYFLYNFYTKYLYYCKLLRVFFQDILHLKFLLLEIISSVK